MQQNGVNMKAQILSLAGNALDLAVAKCEGIKLTESGCVEYVVDHLNSEFTKYSPTTDWSQAGPIILREHISVMFSFDLQLWVAAIGEMWVPEEGGIYADDPLTAAMRCYVDSQSVVSQ